MTPRADPTHAAPAEADRAWLDRAIELACRNVDAGGGPFGAVLVADGAPVAEGRNRVTLDNDPTAHAEVEAIRAGCATLGTFALDGATLYSSCEPCPMCVSAALWARLTRVVYAADRYDAARGGFDDLAFYELFSTAPQHWPVRLENRDHARRVGPFDEWRAKEDRVDY